MSNVAIILGAGSGTRMKMDKSKLLLEIDGKTVIQRSVESFLKVKEIDEIIVTVREEDIKDFSTILTNDKVTFVIGGSSRQKSVKNAVDTIENADLIIIHDGARPLVTQSAIINTINAAKQNKAAAVGVMVKDTIKVIDDDNFIIGTPNRSCLVAIQTPQVFNFELYKNALEKAENEGEDFTDDCQLVEKYGEKVKVVIGDYSNIKITTQEDIPVAQQIISTLEE